MTDGMLRPSLRPWAESLPRDPQLFGSWLHNLFKKALPKYVDAVTTQKTLASNAIEVEPYDPAIGTDPLKLKSGAFAQGTAVGLALSVPLILDRPESARYASPYVKNVILPELRRIRSANSTEQAESRGDWLMHKGAEGIAVFSEITLPLDDMVDRFRPDICSHPYAKAGAGVVLLAMWQGFKTAESHAMVAAVSNMETNPDFNEAMAVFLSRG